MKTILFYFCYLFFILTINAQIGDLSKNISENLKKFEFNKVDYTSSNLFSISKKKIYDNTLKDSITLLENNFSNLEILHNNGINIIHLFLPIGESLDLKEVKLIKFPTQINNDVYGSAKYITIFRGCVVDNYNEIINLTVIDNELTVWALMNNHVATINKLLDKSGYAIHLSTDNAFKFNCLNDEFGLQSYESVDQENFIEKISELNDACKLNLYFVIDQRYYDFLTENHMFSLFSNVSFVYQDKANLTLYLSRWLAIPTQNNLSWYNPDFNGNQQYHYNVFLKFGELMHTLPVNQGGLRPVDHLAAFLPYDQFNNPYGFGVIDGLCDNFYSPNPINGRFSYSRITSLSFFPNYNSNVSLVVHELGHNLGSRHTHWCGWPGGAIDRCAQLEPNDFGLSCSTPLQPYNNSIMSYCNVPDGPYIIANNNPLSFGFGDLPRNLIVNRYHETCPCRTQMVNINNDFLIKENIYLFPNPTENFVFFNDENVYKIFNFYSIQDYAGRTIISGKLINENPINATNLSAGVYSLVLYSETQKIFLKLIKK